MCGRYAVTDTAKIIQSYNLFRNVRFGDVPQGALPRWNASPRQLLPVIAERGGVMRMDFMSWWLIPHWAGPDFKATTFNARSESVDQSKVFSPYFRGSRCLVPAEAFFEWKRNPVPDGAKGRESKQAYCIRMAGGAPFCFAGLFSVAKSANGKEIPTFTILTTEPSDLMRPIHNRMPVILQENDFAAWLDRSYKHVDSLKQLLLPYPSDRMEAFPVSSLVNSPANNEPSVMTPI